MNAYYGMRSLAFAASVLFLGACGGSLTPVQSTGSSYAGDGALALAGAPHDLLAKPMERYFPVKLDARVWHAFGAGGAGVALLDQGHDTGHAHNSEELFRLNTRDSQYDYFLLVMKGSEQVRDFNRCPYDAKRAARYCEYLNGGFTIGATLVAHGAVVGTIVEDSPRGRIDTHQYVATVGAPFSNEISCEAGWTRGVMVAAPAVSPCKTPLSARVTDDWFPQSVTGDNITQSATASPEYKAEFGGIDRPHCKGDFPYESTSTGDIGALAIVRVPRTALYGKQAAPELETTSRIDGFTRSVRVAAGSCAGLTTFDHHGSAAHTDAAQLPDFQVPAAAHGLRVGSDGTVTLVTESRAGMYGFDGLAPSFQLLRNGTTIDPKSVGLAFTPDAKTAAALAPKSTIPFPPHGTWTIAAHDAVKGTYTILVDSAPGGEADSLRAGPISVTLAVE